MEETIPPNEHKTHQRQPRISPTDTSHVFTALLSATALLLGSLAGFIFGLERGRAENLTDNLAMLLGAEVEERPSGLYLTDLITGGPAQLAGIAGDARIIAINNMIDPDYQSFSDQITSLGIGDVAYITTEMSLYITQHVVVLGVYAAPYPVLITPPPPITLPPGPGQSMDARLGVYYRMILPGEVMGLDEGALVITAGSPIADSGAEVGDIITAINSTQVNGADTLSSILDRFSPGEWVTVTLIRAGEEMTVRVRLANQ